MVFALIVIGLLLIPSTSFAWGPLTHIYLGNEILGCAPLIPAGILALITKYRQDYLYGNLMADSVLGKKYLPDNKTSHSWEVGLKLLGQAKTWPEKAFAYGYLSHLAADTVAHEALTEDMRDMAHTWIEMKADSIINKNYWLQSVSFSRAVQRRNDFLLEASLDTYIFSVRTNKRIYKGMVFFSFFNKRRRRGIDRGMIEQLHEVSIARMLDLLQHGTDSSVLTKSPL